MEDSISKFLIFLSQKSSDVFWIRNPDYSKQIYVSPAYEEVWQRKIEDLYNCPEKWDSYLHPEDKEKIEKSLKKRNPQVKREDVFLEEYRIFRPSGEVRYIKDQSFPIFDKSGRHIGFVGIARDVTSEKIYIKKIEEARKAAEAANEAKTEFIANMSHDIRTPMTGIIGMVEDLIFAAEDIQTILQSGSVSTKKKVALLDDLVTRTKINGEIALSSINELLAFYNEILEIVRLDSNKVKMFFRSFDIRELLGHNINLLRSVAKHKGLNLWLDIDNRIPTYLKGLRSYFDRTLLNLISNALKFTDKGRVEVKLTLANTAETFVKGDTITLQIQITDTGIGIPPDKFEVVFEHFSRLTPSYEGIYKGSGLGLYTVKRYVEAMGGSIELDSEVNKGSCFTLKLPFIVDDHADSDESSQTIKVKNSDQLREVQIPSVFSEQKPFGSIANVLLVEDSRVAATAVTSLLNKMGCVVEVAKNGKIALEKVSKVNYDLIFMDLGLPDISGLEVAKKIRGYSEADLSQTPIIALTGHVEEVERQACFLAGMNDVLIKPMRLSPLQSILQRWVLDPVAQEN